MNKKRAISRDEIRAVYRAGEDAVIVLVEKLLDGLEEVAALKARVAALEAQVGKNSGNSSAPPSSEGLKRTKKWSLRGKSGKASGGQAGHDGKTLKAVSDPTAVEVHTVTMCAGCSADLSAVASSAVVERQVFDLPEVRLRVTAHQAEHKMCPQCGRMNRAAFPSGVTQPVQYGPRFRAHLAYLHSGQFIPLARTAELVEGLYGQPVSQATILSAVAEAAERVAPVGEAVRRYLVSTPEVVHCDETGVRVESKLHWLHSAGTAHATLYTVHPKRGTDGIAALGVLPARRGWVVHDGWKPYARYPLARHALCNAHHLRELTGLVEQHAQTWAARMRHWLVHAKQLVDRARAAGQHTLHPEQHHFLTRAFHQLLDQAAEEIALSPPKTSPPRRGRPSASPAANLLRRLRDGQAEVLAFLHDFAVPFDNNLAERDVRMCKVQQKISGTFRSAHGAHAFCAIRGYLSTARKNGLTALHALASAFAGTPFYPPCLSPA